MDHSFTSTDGGRPSSRRGSLLPDAAQSGASAPPGKARVQGLSSNAPQAQALLAARAQAQPEQSSQSAEGRSPESTSEGLSSRLDIQMLFESGIRSGQELLRRGATADAIAAIVVPQVQSELNTQRIQDTLPCWISGLLHGLGGPEVAQAHLKAVISALMRESHLSLHIQQSCLHAIALALSGKNADAGIRIAYSAQGEESLRDLTGPSGAEAGSTIAGGHSAGDAVGERSRRPAWDTRLQELMGGRLKTNEGQLRAWNNGLRGLHLDPLWRMDSGSRIPTPHAPSRSQFARGSGDTDAPRMTQRQTALASASTIRLQLAATAAPEQPIAAAPSVRRASPADSTTDEAAPAAPPPASPPESDAVPQAGAPTGGDSMPADLPPGESAVISQARQGDPRGIEGPVQILALARDLRDRLTRIPDLMTAQPGPIEECLRGAEAALPDDIRVDLAQNKKIIKWSGVTSTKFLRQIEELIQLWHHDLAELDALVDSLEKLRAADEPSWLVDNDGADQDSESCFAALRQRLVVTGSSIRCLLEDTCATLEIGDLKLTAVVQQPSLRTWLEVWVWSAYAAIPRAALIERLIERTLPTLPEAPQDASAQRPRPADMAGDGDELVSWFVAEVQRRRELADHAIDESARGVVRDDTKPESLGEKTSSVSATRERELQALNQRFTERERLTRIQEEFIAKVTLLTGDASDEHAMALALITPSDQDQPRVVDGGGNKGSFTFIHLADMVDTIQQYRERSAKPRQQPEHSGPSMSPLASAQAASDGSPRSRSASRSSEGSESAEEFEASAIHSSVDLDDPEDLVPPSNIDPEPRSD